MKRALSRAWSYFREVVDLWSSRNAFQLAGALAFYTLFSLAPLLIILIALLGIFLGEEAVRGEIAVQIEGFIGPQAAETVEQAVRRARLEESGILPTVLGVGALLFGATTVFAQMQAALNRVWGVVARPSRSGVLMFLVTRLLSLGLLLIIGFLLLVSFVVTMALAALVSHAQEWVPVPGVFATSVDLTLSFTVATLVFATIFKVLPDVNLAWKDMWRGALLTAGLFTLGQYLISLYLTRAAPASEFGAAGSLVLVLMWVYYSSLILFFGAAFTKVSMLRRGVPVEPRRLAVKLRIDVVEEDGDEPPEP
jgi:membrane protein